MKSLEGMKLMAWWAVWVVAVCLLFTAGASVPALFVL